MRWQSTATLEVLRERAQFLQTIRAFFDSRGLWEVDTPLLCQSTVTDPFLSSFHIENRYLQTSPEFAMKRLLAQGAPSLYYLGKAFRQGEVGARHNPEFTMLEWYRVNWSHHQLIDEVDTLFRALIGSPKAIVQTYQSLFEYHLDLNPHVAQVAQLQKIALDMGWVDKNNCPELDRDGWLDLLMTHAIEPHLGFKAPCVVVDYPASQASLAKVREIQGEPSYHVAERFEFYYQGIELCNGYHETNNSKELRARFHADNQKRLALGLKAIPIDELLLSALENNFPACAGVAVGVDRLLMLKLGAKQLKEVIPFDWSNS